MRYTVDFKSHGKSITVDEDTTILAAAALAKIAVEGNCGAAGNCGKCKVHILNDFPFISQQDLIPDNDDIKNPWVFACKYKIHSDLTINVPIQNDSFHRKTKMNYLSSNVNINPSIHKVYVELEQPSINSQSPDYERIVNSLGLQAGNPGHKLLSVIPKILRNGNFSITAITRCNKLMWLEPGDTTDQKYGLIFDIGTTTVVCQLVNLISGVIEESAAITNPQNVFGADVISRINHIMTNCQKNEGLQQLHDKITTTVNDLAMDVIKRKGINKNNVYDATIVGNTTMSHIFLGVDPTYLAISPFVPAYAQGIIVNAIEMGLDINPEANIFLLPNIAGYIGSDTVGVILGAHIHQLPKYSLVIDVGTNGEIVLSGNNRILTCSTAAGPAFEGAQIKCGMRAAEGAIEAIYIDNKTGSCTYETIDRKKPKGMCGSGVIDAVAQLYKNGIIDKFGAFCHGKNNDSHIHGKLKERIRKANHGYEFIIAKEEESDNNQPVVICQKDIRELQMGKGAIFAGIKILMREMGISSEDLKEIMIAGAFGSYIKVESALAIGLLPPTPNGKISSIGNAASEGARLALISLEERNIGCKLAKKCQHIELSSYMEFQDEYMNALNFPTI